MKSNNIVNSLWIDPRIGDLQLLCIRSFISKGIAFHLYTYDEIENAPEGVIIKKADQILDANLVFKDNKNSYATFADWFRIALLHQIGGWWVDCDVFCIRPFNFKAAFVFASEKFPIGNEEHVRVCNAVIKMPPNTNLGKKALQAIAEKLETYKVEQVQWTELGAQLLYQIISEEDMFDYVVIPEAFCPNDYMDFRNLTDHENRKITKDTYAVHLWNKMWEWNEINPLERAIQNSFLGVARKMLADHSSDSLPDELAKK